MTLSVLVALIFTPALCANPPQAVREGAPSRERLLSAGQSQNAPLHPGIESYERGVVGVVPHPNAT